MDIDRLLRDALILANELEYCTDEPVEPLSERAERKIRRMLRNPERTYRRMTRPIPLRILRAAAMVLLALSLLASLAMINPDVRAFVQKVYKEWFPEKVTYTFAEGDEEDLDAAECDLSFEYIPDSYTPFVHNEYYNGGRIGFKNESGDMILVLYRNAVEPLAISADNDEKEYSTTTVRGYPAEVYLAKTESKMNHIYWVERGIVFSILSKLPKEEIILVAEGIEIGSKN